MKIVDLLEIQRKRQAERAERLVSMFGHRELSDSQLDYLLAVGKQAALSMEKEDLVKRFIDDEELIFAGLISTI